MNLIGPASFIIWLSFSLYQGLNRGLSDPEADDIVLSLDAIPHTMMLPQFDSALLKLSLYNKNLLENQVNTS